MEITSISESIDTVEGFPDRKPSSIKKRKRCHKCRRIPIWTNELHGLSQLLKTRTWYERVFWTLIIGSCLLCALWFSRVLFSGYLEERTMTLNTFKRKEKMQYPHIVICPKQADSLNYDSLRHDMNVHLFDVNDEEYYDLLTFVLSGSGIHGMENHIAKWSENYTTYLYERVKHWRGSRTWDEFFNFIFEANGYKCEDLFKMCYYGYYKIHCCEFFRPIYVLKRGRCFRLTEFFQMDEGDLGQLQILMNDMPTNYFKQNGTQPQMVLYLSNKQGDVLSAPRLYMARQTWNEIRYSIKEIQMLPEREQQCNTVNDSIGSKLFRPSNIKSLHISVTLCSINTWLRQQLIDPFNCTFYTFHENFEAPLKTCDPNVIIQNYNWVMKSHVSTTHCVLACERDDIREQKFSSTPGQMVTKIKAPFVLQIQFSELRIEIYKEIRISSIPRFISELGGQVMLYLGVSINTVIQLSLILMHWCRRQYFLMKGRG
ncbi:hypothetical protein M3Y97_01072100 [Aphelenchoides bicaudatus]|nr:hypothetical protein M3Y97_01072100 [Aphelenchoides bicaudatus]